MKCLALTALLNPYHQKDKLMPPALQHTFGRATRDDLMAEVNSCNEYISADITFYSAIIVVFIYTLYRELKSPLAIYIFF